MCAGKQASNYTQPSRDRGKGTYIALTRWVDGEGAADSHMFFFLRRENIHNKPEISENVHTHVPEIFLLDILHNRLWGKLPTGSKDVIKRQPTYAQHTAWNPLEERLQHSWDMSDGNSKSSILEWGMENHKKGGGRVKMGHLRTVQTLNVVVSNVMMSRAPKMRQKWRVPTIPTHTDSVFSCQGEHNKCMRAND